MSWNCNGAGQGAAIGVECGIEYAIKYGIEYFDGLYSYAMVLTRNRVEAEDLVQETYARAIPAMKTLRAGSNIKGWLFTILRNIWLNQLRKWRNGPQMFEVESGVADSIVEPSKDSHDLYVSKLEREQVRAAIQKLPTPFREIILLREYEELSYQEIASVLACPVGTVMSRLGRARTKLRALLQQQEGIRFVGMPSPVRTKFERRGYAV
ncbi:MAG TPA: sigma-70 family RNA polymerase sigma factor [Edaphobacter sp.]|jgi:RNA polymerase sigma-70 factor (ECF subfamily)|nr:sigma-70 family RNA polymerase sigma factor [Edaphobacter sp.]